jgi:hypothetical protein
VYWDIKHPRTSVRMRRRSVGVSGASVAIEGSREMNSGMNPYLTRSYSQGQASVSLYVRNAGSPAGSTCSSILGRGRRFGVKNGIKSEDGVSSLEPSSAVNPMDCNRYVWISVSSTQGSTHPFGYSPLDNGIQANKGTAQYEQHVRRVNLVHVRFR